MLKGIYPTEELKGLVAKKKSIDFKESFPKKLVDEAKDKGWQEHKELKQ